MPRAIGGGSHVIAGAGHRYLVGAVFARETPRLRDAWCSRFPNAGRFNAGVAVFEFVTSPQPMESHMSKVEHIGRGYPWGAADSPRPDVGALVHCYVEPNFAAGNKAQGAHWTELSFAEHDAWNGPDGVPTDLTTRYDVRRWRPRDDDLAYYEGKLGPMTL